LQYLHVSIYNEQPFLAFVVWILGNNVGNYFCLFSSSPSHDYSITSIAWKLAKTKMASEPQNSDLTFPPADVVGELHPEINTNVQVDPSSSEMAAYKEKKVHFIIFIYNGSSPMINMLLEYLFLFLVKYIFLSLNYCKKLYFVSKLNYKIFVHVFCESQVILSKQNILSICHVTNGIS